jgi:hypothetical protein
MTYMSLLILIELMHMLSEWQNQIVVPDQLTLNHIRYHARKVLTNRYVRLVSLARISN